MKCFKCKKEIESTDKFCPYCGAKQGFDQGIIDRAIKGESEAQAELYNNTYSDVYYTIFAITKDEDLLFDVLQDTYLTAFQKLDQLNNADSFRPWVKRIAHNKTLNALRDRKPSKMTFLVSADTEEVIEIKDDRIENMPEEKMDQKETGRLVKEILDALPEDQRAVIGMYYFEQMSINEIAEELGCSGNTIKSRLNYGRKKIESQVLELEKQGTKLYSLAPITFFLWLLQSLRKQPDEKMFASVRKELQNLGANTKVNSEKMAKSVTEKASVKESASVTEIGKAATTVGKGISMKILAGVAAVAVVAGTAGYMTIQQKNSDANVEQNAGQTETQVQTEQETVVETQTELQTEAVTETQVETETETQTEKKPETVLAHIENLGYTYIGGTSYDVTYHTGHPYQENGPEAGISLDAAPTGVAGAMKRDMDGDGKEELLLAVLKPADQVFLNNGKRDAKLYFEVYSGEDGEWTLQGETSEEQAFNVYLTDVLPNIKVVCVGTDIYIERKGNAAFSADPAYSVTSYSYNGNSFHQNDEMGEDGWQYNPEVSDIIKNSSSEDLLCEFIIPEIYEEENYDLVSTLYSGTPISVTLELRDNGWVESDSGETEQAEADQEEESEKIIEIGDASTEAADSKTVVEFSEEDKELYKVFLTDYYNNTSSNASYLLLDIDQNGTPELFIMDNNQTRGPMGYTKIGIWSIQKHKVVDVGEVYDRARCVRYNQKKLGVVGQTGSAMYVDWALRYFEGNELRVESLYNQYQDPVSYTFGILDRNFTTYYEKRDLTAEEYETIYNEDFNETDIKEMYMIQLTPEEIDNI